MRNGDDVINGGGSYVGLSNVGSDETMVGIKSFGVRNVLPDMFDLTCGAPTAAPTPAPSVARVIVTPFPSLSPTLTTLGPSTEGEPLAAHTSSTAIVFVGTFSAVLAAAVAAIFWRKLKGVCSSVRENRGVGELVASHVIANGPE
jgi:hypothetical protein